MTKLSEIPIFFVAQETFVIVIVLQASTVLVEHGQDTELSGCCIKLVGKKAFLSLYKGLPQCVGYDQHTVWMSTELVGLWRPNHVCGI